MTEPEIELMKKQIEIQLEEYAEAINAYDKFMADWRARQPKGFKGLRPKPVSEARG